MTATRQIVIDTETTGTDFRRDRIVEIGAVELVDMLPTCRTFHAYVNPGMPVPAEARAIHGLTDDFLADKPAFADIADDLLTFIGDSALVAHNAGFDLGFLSAAFRRPLDNPVIDTLAMARAKHPGANCTLDALCARYGVSTATRHKHGALLDAELLAAIYIELMGRQATMDLVVEEQGAGVVKLPTRQPLPQRLTPAELEAHAAMVAGIENSIWKRIAA